MTSFSLFVATLLYMAAAADPVAQTIGHGQINWTDKTLTVTGSGAPSLKAANAAAARLGAERAAKLDAMRNALEAVRGLRLSGNDNAGAAIDATPELKAKISGVIQGFKTVDIKYYSDGGVDMILTWPLDGVLAAALVANSIKGTDATITITAGDEAGVSGLVVDAKGLGVTPALAPRLLDEDGNSIYAASLVTPEAFREHGMVEYVKSIELGKQNNRVGPKPLLVKAKTLTATGSADLILLAADAEKIRKLHDVLAHGKVVIVSD
jgi:hypothetical protein